jgi:hypothetical protein
MNPKMRELLDSADPDFMAATGATLLTLGCFLLAAGRDYDA